MLLIILYRRHSAPNLKVTGQVGLQRLWCCKYSCICSVKDVEWEDSQDFLLQKNIFLWRIRSKNHLRTIHFAWSGCSWWLPRPLKPWGLSITPVRAMGDWADEEYKLYLKSVKAPWLLVLQGLREFQAHVEPLVYPVLSLTRRPPIPSQPGCCGAKTLRGHVCCFVDPLRLIKGTSHKLLWGTGQSRWEPHSGFWLNYCNTQAKCQPDSNEFRAFT